MIYKFLKKIGQHSIIYGVGNMAHVIPGFILIPLYTRYLVPAEYGIFSLLTALFGILLYIYELGMVGAVNRQFYEHDDNRKRKQVISTAFFSCLAYSFILTVGILFFKNRISGFLFKTVRYEHIVFLGLIAVFFQAAIFIPQTVMRLREKPVHYIILVGTRIFLLIVFTVLFLAVFGKGLVGLYQALLLTAFLSFIFYMASTIKNFAFSFSFSELKHLLYLGLAFFPALILTWVIESSDRYILDILTNLSAVGIYSVGYKVGQITMLLVKSFYLAWIPIMFSIVKEESAARIFGKIGTYFILVVSLFVFGLSMCAKEVIQFLTTPEYAGAYRVVSLICLSYLFYGLYVFFLTGVIIKKNVYSLPVVLFVGAALNVGLNFLLIPRYGIMGAASATLVSYMSIAILTYFFSQKSYYIVYEIKKMVKIIIFGIAIHLLSSFITTENIYLSLSIKAVLLCSYVFILYFSRIITETDFLKVKSVFVRRLRG